jgi:two-component system chemotaxis response regulator CheY
MRMLIKEMLNQSGFEVVGEAADGAQAVEKYRALLPDAVTMDMVLAELDGTAAVKAIISEFPQARIVMCTSTVEQALVEVIRAGAKGYITKPFQRPKLAQAIDKVLPAL